MKCLLTLTKSIISDHICASKCLWLVSKVKVTCWSVSSRWCLIQYHDMVVIFRCKGAVSYVGKNSQNIVFTGSADSEMSEEQKKEKLSELRKKEQEIQDILAKKTKELKKICLREAVRNHFILHFFCTGAIYILQGIYESFFVSKRRHSFSWSPIIKPCCCAAGQIDGFCCYAQFI